MGSGGSEVEWGGVGLPRAMEHLMESGVQVHRANKWGLKEALAASRRLSGALINWVEKGS